MSGPAYWGKDKRPKIDADWSTPIGSPVNATCTIDTSANRSTIVLALAQGRGLTFEGLVNVGTAGAPVNAVELSGGELAFEAADAAGSQVTLRDTEPILILAENLLGNDILGRHRVTLTVDYTASPPSVTLTV